MFKIIFLTIIITISIFGCSADYKKLINEEYNNNNSFNNTLIKEYKKKAVFEAEEMHDWNSAKLYSKKAIISAKGELIKPEIINKWDIKNNNNVNELMSAYDNLIIIYEDALSIDPINLAKSIVALDCWAEQEEEGWQTNHIQKCKSEFLNSMHLIYNKIKEDELISQKNNKDNKSSSLIINNNIEEKIIYFDFNKHNISYENKLIIKEYLLNKYYTQYLIIGHTDTLGTKEYNYKLSKARSLSVKEILLNFGINIDKIRIIAKGETDLAIFTPDEVRHPANRRVVIKLSY